MELKYGVFKKENKLKEWPLSFVKKVLGVGTNCSNQAVLGELGMLPLKVVYMLKCVKYWLKILCLRDVGRVTWASKIKQVLFTLGFGEVWMEQGVGNIELFL